jgi:hypothetical protein
LSTAIIVNGLEQPARMAVSSTAAPTQTEWSFPPLARIDPPALRGPAPAAHVRGGGGGGPRPLLVTLTGGAGKKRRLIGCGATVVEHANRAGWARVVVQGETHAWRSGSWHLPEPHATLPQCAAAPAVAPDEPASVDNRTEQQAAHEEDAHKPWLPPELLEIIIGSVEDPKTKAALAMTCRTCREALALTGWPEVDLRYGRAGKEHAALALIGRLGTTRARPRTLKIDCDRSELGLLRWIAERCDLSALEHLELSLFDGFQHALADASDLRFSIDLSSDSLVVDDPRDAYGLRAALAALRTPAARQLMSVFWAKKFAETVLVHLLRRLPCLARLKCSLGSLRALRALEGLTHLRTLTLGGLQRLWHPSSGCTDSTKDLHDTLARLPSLEEL